MISVANNYIHYHLYNYFRYGVSERPEGDSFKNEGEFIKPIEIFNEHKRNIINMIRMESKNLNINTTELERELNTAFDIGKAGPLKEEDMNFLQNVQQALIDYFQENGMAIQKSMEESFVMTGNAATSASGMAGSTADFSKLPQVKKNMNRHVKNLKNSKTGHTYKSLMQAIKDFEKVLEFCRQDINAGGSYQNFHELEKDIENIKLAFKAINPTSNNQIIKWKDATEFYQLYYKILKQWQTNKTTLLKGELGEILVATLGTEAGRRAAYLGIDEFKKYLKNGLNIAKVGSQTSTKVLLNISSIDLESDFSAFDRKSYGKTLSLKDISDTGVDATIAFAANSPTQEKVDVILDWPGFRNITTSVKNYNSKGSKNISLHSGRSLYQMVQLHTNFLGHYANVMSTHGAWKKGVKKNLSAERSAAIEAMKITAALYALRGGMLIVGDDGRLKTMKPANVFIMNDYSQGKFKVVTISHIMNNIERNLELFNLKPKLDNVRYNNKWVGSKGSYNEGHAIQRMSNVWSQIHAHKLEASIKHAALN